MKHFVKRLFLIWMCVMLSSAQAGEEDGIFTPETDGGFAVTEEPEIRTGDNVSAISEEPEIRVEKEWPSLAYLIGPGDVLDISVWKNAEMSRVVTVLPDGRISFPLIGEIMASGKTVALLKEELENKLSPRYILDPVLSVEVRQINSMLIYVIGRVNNPGRFVLNTYVNVLQVLSMAGGLNPFAKRNSVRIFREEQAGTRIFEFRYDDVADGDNMDQNIRLRRGDVIVVP